MQTAGRNHLKRGGERSTRGPRAVVAIAVFSSSAANASGGEVLGLIWLDAMLVFLIMMSVIFGRLKKTGNAIVVAASGAAVLAPWWLMSDWPYAENRALIEAICVCLPATVWFSVFLLASRHYAKT